MRFIYYYTFFSFRKLLKQSKSEKKHQLCIKTHYLKHNYVVFPGLFLQRCLLCMETCRLLTLRFLENCTTNLVENVNSIDHGENSEQWIEKVQKANTIIQVVFLKFRKYLLQSIKKKQKKKI